MKKVLLSLLVTLVMVNLTACGEKTNNQETGDDIVDNCNLYPTTYTEVNALDPSDIENYLGEVGTNLPVENGVIVSPYYTMKANGVEVPVYATRTANTIHSFAWIDVEVLDKATNFHLGIELELSKNSSVLFKKNPNVIVLPEKHGVIAELDDRKVTASITNFGSYSFVFNKKQDEALTLFVAEKENINALFGTKEIKYLEPGDYSTTRRSKTLFEQQEMVYYFKSGRYLIDQISVPANSILYLEQGAYLEVLPTAGWEAIKSIGEANIIIAGRGLVDYSACCGGEVPAGYSSNKGGLVFNNVKNITFSGVTVINSQTWTLCLNACEDIKVFNCFFFGYRVYADGIMLSDCKNALVERNFIRTGDDAFETKSTTTNGLTENVWFKNNDAWSDKGVAYGCIYESNHDTSDVHFEDCTVGFALGTWSPHLGCCVIQMGNRKGAKMSNITFENFEIFSSSNQALLNIYIGGSGGRGEGWGDVDQIYFKNITAKRNYGAFLNLQTYEAKYSSIGRVYVDNIVSNDVQLTKENYQTDGYVVDKVSGGYDFKYLQINTLLDKE